MRGKFVSFLAAAVVLTAGALVASAPAQAQQTYRTAEMAPFDGFAAEIGAGTLTRSEDEIWLTVSAQGLDKKAAYTVWWVIFNDPTQCAGPCGLGDLFTDAVDGSVFYAAGFVTGTDGSANVTAHLPDGDIAEGIDVVIGDGSVIGGPNSCGPAQDCDTGEAPGLFDDNGFDAEVHVVLRTHSATIAGRVDEQIGSFLGACDETFCADQHFLVFPPTP